MTPAYAQSAPAIEGVPWRNIIAGAPQYFLGEAVGEATCKEVNLKTRGDNGIRAAADPAVGVQCFGTGEPYTVVAQLPSESPSALTTEALQTALNAAGARNTKLEVVAGGGAWQVAPTITQASSGSCSGSGSSGYLVFDLEAGSYPSPCWITTTMPGTCPKGTTCI